MDKTSRLFHFAEAIQRKSDVTLEQEAQKQGSRQLLLFSREMQKL